MVKDGAMDSFILWSARRRKRGQMDKAEGKGSSWELPYNTFAYIPGSRMFILPCLHHIKDRVLFHVLAG